jgi:hypothetical protein
MRAAVAFGAAAVLTLLGWTAWRAQGDPAPAPVRRSEAVAGPYRVVVDRIAHNRKITLDYEVPPKAVDGPAAQFSRTVHLQLAVFTKEPAAGPGLSTFQVRSVLADNGSRLVELPHYGGMLETSNDGAILRAYVYLPNFPLAAKEVRAVEGEIVAYERSTPVQIEIPVVPGKTPEPVEKDGIRATVREWEQDKDEIRAVIWLEGPPNTVLINTTTDGTYGVALFNSAQKPASTQGGSLVQPRPNQAEYRVGFLNLRGTPEKLKIQLLHRSGPRRVYPFRIEHVEVPSRAAAASPAGAQGGQEQK